MRAFMPIAAIVLFVCAFQARSEETTDFDAMPRIRIPLPDQTQVEAIRRNGAACRIVFPNALPVNLEDGADICFVAQFVATVKPAGIKLLDCSLVVRAEDSKIFGVASSYKPGEYVAFFGQIKKSDGGRTIEFVATELLKQKPEVERLVGGVVAIDKEARVVGLNIDDLRRISQRYIQKGDEIALALKRPFRPFDESAHLEACKAEAYKKGMDLAERTVQSGDADACFALAEQWKDLCHNRSKEREWVLNCLKIDAEHRAASAVAQEKFDLEKFDKQWMTHGEADERRAADRHLDQLKAAQLKAFLARREREIAERTQRLTQFEADLRVGDLTRRRETIVALGDAIKSAADPVYAQLAIDLLANVDGAEVLASLNAAQKSEIPEVRQQVVETLAWRESCDAWWAKNQ